MFVEKKEKRLSKWMLFVDFLLCGLVLIFSPVCSFEVHAQDDTEYTQTDLEQDERLNSLEKRLEEIGYTIDETVQAIISLQEADVSLEEQRIEISEKLDLCIIALNDLINYSIEGLDKADASEVLTEEYRTEVLTDLETNEAAMVTLNENTVSGNTILTDFNDSVTENLQLTSENTLQELNKTLSTTNTFLSYLFVLLLVVLALFVTNWIGALINKFILKHVQ